MSPASRRGPRRRRLFPFLLIVTALLTAWLGPRVVRARSALQWTRFHAAQAPDAFGQNARGLARWSVQTLDDAAPLPWGATACRLALDFGGRQEPTNPAAALALYEKVRSALERVSASRWRGFGLSGVLEEARQREQALRGRPDIVKP
jgi:hypothetical protein